MFSFHIIWRKLHLVSTLHDISIIKSSIADIHFLYYMVKKGGSPKKIPMSPSFSSYKK
jgi:hypothetical protein